MFAVIVALVLLFASVAAIYLLLKNMMSEDGIDIAAPGSCRRGRCGVPRCTSVEEAEAVPLRVADVDDQGKGNS